MSSLLPEGAPPRISLRAAAPSREDLANLDALLVIVPSTPADSTWKSVPNGDWLRAELARRRCKPGTLLTTRVANVSGTLVVLGLRAAQADAFQTLTLAGRMFKEARGTEPRRIGLAAAGLKSAGERMALEALAAATLAGSFELPSFKSEARPRSDTPAVTLFGRSQRLGLERTRATAEGNNLARWLTALPGNRLTAASYRERIVQLARRDHGIWSALRGEPAARAGHPGKAGDGHGNTRKDTEKESNRAAKAGEGVIMHGASAFRLIRRHTDCLFVHFSLSCPSVRFRGHFSPTWTA